MNRGNIISKGFITCCLVLVQFGNIKAQDSSRNFFFLKDHGNAYPSGRGVGLGADMTSFGGNTTMNARVYIPLVSLFSVNIRLFYIPNSDTTHDKSLGFRPELVMHSAVVLNLMRVYLGFGPQFFYGIKGLDKNTHDISGGWEIGIESFASSQLSGHLEIGTGGGTVGGIGAGPTFGAGFIFYPFYKQYRKQLK